MKLVHTDPHGQRRAAEYPDIGDQLDALWKTIGKLPAKSVDPATREMLEQIQAIKAAYPKPE